MAYDCVSIFLSLPQHCDDNLLHSARAGHDAPAALPVLPRLLQPGERRALHWHHRQPGHDSDTLRNRRPHQLLQTTVRQEHHQG